MKFRVLEERSFWRLVLFLAGFYLIFELLYILKVEYFLSLAGKSLSFFELLAYVIDWVLVTVYMALISIHTSQLLRKNKPWKRIIAYHIFFSIFISLVIRLVIDLYQIGVGFLTFEDYNFNIFITGILHSIDVNYVIYAAMTFMIYSFYYLGEVRKSEKQRNILKTQLLDTKIKMLTSQLQPHFLFNTLNSITSLIDIDKIKAQDTIADLSNFLRKILYHSNQNFVTVEKEMEILEPYFNILRTRFHKKISIKVFIEEDLIAKEIPSLILQPIIENAVKHGSFSEQGKLKIQISIHGQDSHVILKVTNSGTFKNGAGGKDSSRKGIGLANITDRLKNLYGELYTFSLAPVSANEVSCTVKIPEK